jgi:hypothetical protein
VTNFVWPLRFNLPYQVAAWLTTGTASNAIKTTPGIPPVCLCNYATGYSVYTDADGDLNHDSLQSTSYTVRNTLLKYRDAPFA